MAFFKLTKSVEKVAEKAAGKGVKAAANAAEEAAKIAAKNGRKLGKAFVGAKRITMKEAKQRLQAGELFNRAKRSSNAKRVPIPGDADFVGPIPSGGWKLSPRGQGAHMIERVNVKGRPDLTHFDQKTTPRFYPKGTPESAGQAHMRIHQATKEAGIGLQGGNPNMTDAQLIDAYKKAYSNSKLEGIVGDLRTPDGKVVVGKDLTPTQAMDELLKWGK